jgi:hypothetical protein
MDAILSGQVLFKRFLMHSTSVNGLIMFASITPHTGPLNAGIGNHPGHLHGLAMAKQAIVNSLLNLEGIKQASGNGILGGVVDLLL